MAKKYANSLELRDRQAVLMKRCKDIVATCKKEIREMTPEEEDEFNKNKEEIKKLREDLDELTEKLSRYEDELPEDEEDREDDEEDEELKEDELEDPEEEIKKIRKTRSMKTNKKRFNLMKELRNAMNTGKSVQLRTADYSVGNEGGDVVATDLFDIWGPLRAKNVLVEAGAQYIPGIKNNIQIPLMGAVSVAWAAEKGAAVDGSGEFTSKTLTPKRITAKYPVSLELLAQDSIGIEQAIRNDIINAINAKIEETILGSAAGSTTQPAGMFNGKTKNVITAFAGITALEASVESANVYGECKYIVAPSAKADLRGMAKSAKTTELVMENGEIDGTPVLSTTHVKDKDIVYGDFSNLVIATWDNIQLDVVRDVASLGNGQVTIVVNAYMDAAVVRDEAFAFGTTQTA